jgi:hypothetical protein
MSPDSGHWPGGQKVLVLSEKEFKNRHREDLRLVNAKQRCLLEMGRWAGSRRSSALRVLRPQDFIGVCRHGGGQS